MSALLYREDSRGSNRKKTITKVVESFFVVTQNKMIPLEELALAIDREFSLLFHDNEIMVSIEGKHFVKSYSHDMDSGYKDTMLCLTEDRYQYLLSIQNENVIYYHIEEFYKHSSLTDEGISLTEYIRLIENFLYTIFIQNLEKSQSFFNRTIEMSKLVEQYNFDNKQKEYINMFLEYDSLEKDRAIFNIGSWAIEYITINGGIDLNSQLNNITEKTLYLDTNVLFRMIGIDGERRQNRLYEFLRRCHNCGQTLKISKMVMDEYQKSLETGVNHIRRIPDHVKFIKPIENSIVQHYYRTNNISIDLFLAEIDTLFKSFVKDLKIEIETYDFYKLANGKDRAEIDSCSASIKEYKRHMNDYQSKPDASNIVYIKKLRGEHYKNINESKFFFLTVDKTLANWEQEKSEGCPITMRPSDWLTLLLNYVTRTNDDYKAFVSFIHTVIHTDHKEPDVVLAMLEGISKIASKLENQEEIYTNLISMKYEEMLKIESYDQKVEFARDSANEYLEKRIINLEKSIDESSKAMNEMRSELERSIENTKQIELNSKEARDNHITYVYKQEKLRTYAVNIISLFVIFTSLFILSLIWVFTTVEWNYIYSAISKKPDELLTWQLFLTGILVTTIGSSIAISFKYHFGDKSFDIRLFSMGLTLNEIKKCKNNR